MQKASKAEIKANAELVQNLTHRQQELGEQYEQSNSWRRVSEQLEEEKVKLQERVRELESNHGPSPVSWGQHQARLDP